MQSGPRPVSIGDHDRVSARPDIARLVAATERYEGLASLAIMAVFIGMPLVGNLLEGHPILAVVNAVLLGLIGTIIVRLVWTLVLTPVRRVRYRRAARMLDTVVAAQAPAGAARHSWSQDAPGALVICLSDCVLLIDRSTKYSLTRLTRDQLAGVEIVTDISLHSIEHRRPGVMIAAPL